jgi:LacI family transcriptional regulator
MKKSSKVTLVELSREIGISRTTIYKILNDKGKVSDATREKVLEAVSSYNYVPNLAAKNLALHRSYHIAFVGYNSPQAPYTLNNLRKGIQWAADEFSDYGLKVTHLLTEAGNSEQQVNETCRLADEGVDAFAIYPDLVVPMSECIDRLSEKGKYVITVNKDVPSSSRHAYVGSNYYKSGVLAAEVLARMIPPGQELAVLLGGRGAEFIDVQERYRGLMDKMVRFPSITLRPPYIHDGSFQDGRLNDDSKHPDLETYLKELIGSVPNLGGILDITCDLDLAGRVVHEYSNSVRLVGFDLCDTVRDHMISHSIDAVIFQDTISQGYQAVKLLFQALTEDSSGGLHVPDSKLEVVYEGNLEFYI